MFQDKKIFILGFARSGYEVAKILANRNNKILLNDMNENQDPKQVKELQGMGVNIVLGNHDESLFDDTFDYLIKNPGIKNDHLYVKMANSYNIPVINELEVAYHLMPKDVKIIGITGTNGKTTTTTLIYEMIKNMGYSVHLTGNMGFPLCGFLKDIKEKDIVVTEVSIQQLCNFKDFKTNISIFTNLSEAHLDFVGDYENYQNIKKRIFNHHTKEDIAILNGNDNLVCELIKDINSTKKYFGKDTCYIKDDYIYYKDEAIIKLEDIFLKGSHNYENVMASIATVKELNVSNEVIVKVLKTFRGVAHRLEFVRNLNGRVFYNDSKATNNKATQIALKTFHTPTIIIMGGLDRGQSFEELTEYMNHVKLIVCYGETKDKIESFAKTLNINVIKTNNLIEATDIAYQNSKEKDTILLSPACASWDQYKKFEDRGDEYKNHVMELK